MISGIRFKRVGLDYGFDGSTNVQRLVGNIGRLRRIRVITKVLVGCGPRGRAGRMKGEGLGERCVNIQRRQRELSAWPSKRIFNPASRQTSKKAQEGLSNYFEWVDAGKRRLRRHRTILIALNLTAQIISICGHSVHSVPLRDPFREIPMASSFMHGRVEMKGWKALIRHSP